jgi:hypothetical protein
MSSPLFVSLCFPKICLSIPHLNDAIGWILIYLHEFLVNSCGSFIGLLFSTYCAGTVGWKRSTWIWFGCVDIVNSLTQPIKWCCWVDFGHFGLSPWVSCQFLWFFHFLVVATKKTHLMA